MKPAKSFFLLFVFLCILVIGLTTNCSNEPNLGTVDESYKPDHPIEFPHDIHAGKNGIDYKFCHNVAFDEKNTGIPSANVCMKCHKEVKGNPSQRIGK
jgi:hypothetical protein